MRNPVEKFKPSDIVQLMSGGPEMTVGRVFRATTPEGGQMTVCQAFWFGSSVSEVSTAVIPAVTLRRIVAKRTDGKPDGWID